MKRLAALMLLMMTGAALTPMGSARAAEPAPAQPRYVILMVGDGMQMAHEIAYSRFSTGRDKGLIWHSFAVQLPCTTWDVNTYNRHARDAGADSYDADGFDPRIGYSVQRGGAWTYDGQWDAPDGKYLMSAATDSASAGTALSCGVKTDKGNIAWRMGDPANGALHFIGQQLRQDGGAYGVVSTVQFSHATPAAFSSHNVARGNYGGIGHEIAAVTQPDVVIGAGHPRWSNGFKYLPETDYKGLKKREAPYDDFVFVERRKGTDGNTALAEAAAQAVADGRKLFGLYGGESNYCEHPVPMDNQAFTPRLPRKLGPRFLWTDQAAENPSLAASTRAALDVLRARGGSRGFVLMVEGGDIDWANHANDYAWMIGAMHQFHEAVREVERYVDDQSNRLNWSNTLLIVTSDHSNSYMRFNPDKRLGRGRLPQQVRDGNGWAYPDGEVTYGSRGHTNEPVMVYARGVGALRHGAERFKHWEGRWYPGTQLIDNTHIHDIMCHVLGLKTANKAMTPDLPKAAPSAP